MADFSLYTGPSEEWLALKATLPAPPDFVSLDVLKAEANAGREAIAAKALVTEGLQSQVAFQDYSIPARDGVTLQARTYRPASLPPTQPLPVYIHFHGGGYFLGTLASEDAICSRIVVGLTAESTPVVVVNVNYRHTPEHKYPIAWNDAEDAFHWVHDHLTEIGGDADQVIVGGISAGAHLTASLVLAQHLGTDEALLKRPKVKGQVLMIPSLVSRGCYAGQLAKLKDPRVSSYVQNEHAPILPASRVDFFIGLLEPFGVDKDLRLNPGNATPDQVKGMPPTTFGVAGRDPLRDEGLLYAMLLAENGVPTDVNVFTGLPHGFRRHGALSESKRWDAVMNQGIKWALGDPVATGAFDIKDK
ncbi:putative lipase/esterase [Aspergillus steynii IBT 23096]|uniref:Putative lipase/esterase n=1 Tax=Aspergillus steynii IBT 23096 TaxID=1392250 RepID=A0A2I2GEY3_9EURO|nr:putative lipase/esterase [Aspergillus steynii IBT 23096]PLB51440.1 putative lipase/esterase [Aspergillus steynii IBT 23096]